MTKRNYGIDLLRSIAMLMVVYAHILKQGGVLSAESWNSFGYYFTYFFEILAISSLDCFVLISGYVMCKNSFRLHKLISLWLQVVFWSVSVSCVLFVLWPETRTINEAVSMFLPIFRSRYWFFTAYFIMFLFTPVLNHIINTLSKKEFKLMILTAVVLFGILPVFALGGDFPRIKNGDHFAWLMVAYLIGGYIRMYGREKYEHPKRLLLMAFGGVLINVIYKAVIENMSNAVFGHPNYGDLLLGHSSPLILGVAVCLFLFFQSLDIKENSFAAKLSQFTAPLVFSVYIIHVHPGIYWSERVIGFFAPLAELNPLLTVATVIGIALGIFVVCILLDSVRLKIFEFLRVQQFSKWMDKKISGCVNRMLKLEVK